MQRHVWKNYGTKVPYMGKINTFYRGTITKEHHLLVSHPIYTVEPLIMDTPKSPYNGQTVCPLPIYCPYISTSEEGTTSEQWTKCSSPTCPLFGGSTVYPFPYFILCNIPLDFSEMIPSPVHNYMYLAHQHNLHQLLMEEYNVTR